MELAVGFIQTFDLNGPSRGPRGGLNGLPSGDIVGKLEDVIMVMVAITTEKRQKRAVMASDTPRPEEVDA